MLVAIAHVLTGALSLVARAFRRSRPLEVRAPTPTISQLPRSIGIPTAHRRKHRDTWPS